MSKFATMINAVVTGDKKVKPLRYASARLDTGNINSATSLSLCKAVKITAEFNRIVYIDDYELERDPHAVEHALRNVKLAMVEDMFGEFRGMIRDAIAGTYDYDTDRTRDALVALEAAMFRDGI